MVFSMRLLQEFENYSAKCFKKSEVCRREIFSLLVFIQLSEYCLTSATTTTTILNVNVQFFIVDYQLTSILSLSLSKLCLLFTVR